MPRGVQYPGVGRWGSPVCPLLVFVALLQTCLSVLALQAAADGRPTSIDVVTLALKPSCVNRAVISSLNKHLVPKPRTIIVITSTGCDTFRQFAPNVACYQEDDVVPGLTLAWVRAALEAGLAVQPDKSRRRMTGRAGWLLQQLLKLAAASGTLPGVALTPHMLLWDSDMVVLRPMELFVPVDLDAAPAATTATTAPAAAACCTNPFPFMVRRHAGGFSCAAYVRAHAALTRGSVPPVPYYLAPERTSLVSHHAVVYVPYMVEFLEAITAPRHADEALGWARSVMDAVLAQPGVSAMVIGFSEYASYGSWVAARHPCTATLAPTLEWRRAVAGWPAFAPGASVAYAGGGGNGTQQLRVCCPTRALLDGPRRQGLAFVGFELGHFRQCGYSHPAHAAGYAAWYTDGDPDLNSRLPVA